MTDNLAFYSALIALAVSAGTLFAVALDLWTTRRKAGRQRFALPAVRNEYNSEALAADFRNELRLFIQNNHLDPNAADRVRRDLERIAVLAIADDLIIDRTAQAVREQIANMPAGAEALLRLRELADNWMISSDAGVFLTISPSRVDPIRGAYEFQKKRLVLFKKLQQATT